MNRFRFLLSISLFLLMTTALTGVGLSAHQGGTSTAKPPVKIHAGEPAPALELEKLLQAPAGAKTDWPSLKGNVVVLEFWATWCAPCIAAIPHLNELAEQFKDKPVKFISITEEDEATITSFLNHRTIKGWVGLDLDSSVFEAYLGKIALIPRTVIVDQQGKVVSVSSPSAEPLTAEQLNQILEGKVALPTLGKTIEEAKQTPLSPAKVGKEAASTQSPRLGIMTSSSGSEEEKEPVETDPPQLGVTIRPSKSSGGQQVNWGPGKYRASGATLKTLLRDLCSINDLRIDVPAQLQSLRYDINATVKDGKIPVVKQLVLHSLETALSIKVQRVTREVEVYVLTAPGQLTGNLKPSQAPASEGSKAGSARGALTGKNTEIKSLARGIEDVLKLHVIDETNLQGRYNWDMLYDTKNPQSVIEAVRKELGLELKLTRRAIEMLTVEVN